ncbi:MAG: hypothetical protein JXR88_07320 [Clostridia bacterium]|nr:hypothetical protein [Clostridia bacterium]
MKYIWQGIQEPFLDEIHLQSVDHVMTGLYGGSIQSGANKNEDAFLVMTERKQVIALLFDAHTCFDSISYFLENLDLRDLERCFEMSLEEGFKHFEEIIMLLLHKPIKKELKGETAIMMVYERDGYLKWISVGDNSLYVYHDETMCLNQYRLNSRVFFQWYGHANSLQLTSPCYQQGVIELRQGYTDILMLTDGILEIEDSPYLKDQLLYEDYKSSPRKILETVKERKGRDNATYIGWSVYKSEEALRPTRSLG